MSKTKRPSADELREMANHTTDPVIERALRQLACDIEDERLPAARRANPDEA